MDEKLAKKGMRLPDIAMAGGFASEDGVFKALAMGSPYVKAVCMGRGLMIPGMVGKNIGNWLAEGNLPNSVSKYGKTANEIFVNYAELEEKFGSKMKDIPLGAVGIYTYCQKFKVGLRPHGANRRRSKNLRHTLRYGRLQQRSKRRLRRIKNQHTTFLSTLSHFFLSSHSEQRNYKSEGSSTKVLYYVHEAPVPF